MAGRKRRLPNYAARVLDEIAQVRAEGQLKPGTIHLIDVYHDEWCDLLKGMGPCNCTPEVGPMERVPSPDEN